MREIGDGELHWLRAVVALAIQLTGSERRWVDRSGSTPMGWCSHFWGRRGGNLTGAGQGVGEEVGGTSGQVHEHWGTTVELGDMQAAPDGGRNRLSTWRPLSAAAQWGTSIGGAAQRLLAPEDGPGRSSVLTESSMLRRLGRGMAAATQRWGARCGAWRRLE
jgi:hypothetical protein